MPNAGQPLRDQPTTLCAKRNDRVHALSLREVAGAEKWQLRVELAAAYRHLAAYCMSDPVLTHVSARIPGPENHFLIHPAA